MATVGSSLARVTCETSHILHAGGKVVLLGDRPFLTHLTIDWNEWNNLDGPLNLNKKKKKLYMEDICLKSRHYSSEIYEILTW